MLFWTIVAVMLAAAAFFVLWPLRAGDEAEQIDPRKVVLIERLERMTAEGIADQEIERSQIARQLLALEEKPSSGTTGGTSVVLASIIALVTIPALVIPLYFSLGSPAGALSASALVPFEDQPLDAMVVTAERHLKNNPDDIQGWTVLARVYGTQGRIEERVNALENLARLQPANIGWKTDLAQALATRGGNIIPDRAVGLLDEVLQVEPDDEKANFFRAVAYEQAGDGSSALVIWRKLSQVRPTDANWQTQISQRIAALSQPAASITSQTQQALENAPADVRDEMIRGMVEGLAERLERQPDDLQGWRRLLQAYTVLGTPEKALEALDAAISNVTGRSDLSDRLMALRASAGEVN